MFAKKKYRILYSVYFIVILTFLSLATSLFSNFVNWDDDKLVIHNDLIKNISGSALKKIFISPYLGLYHPLVFLSYALEYHFFGLDPFIYHATNLILHILNSLLVFWLIFILSDNICVSFICGLLFGIHPLHVESVAWISERKDVLSGFFFLLACVYYLIYKKRNNLFYYCVVFLSFIFALLSKPMAVTLPLALLLFDYLSHRKFNKRTLLEKAPLFILSIIFGVMTIFSQISTQDTGYPHIYKNIFVALKNIIFYLNKTVAPIQLSAFYPYPQEMNILSVDLFITIIFLSFLIAAVFYSIKYTRKIVFGSLLFFITILLVLKAIPFGRSFIVADRFMYIPSIGLFYLVGVAFCWLYDKKIRYERIKKCFLISIFSVISFVFCILSWQRCAVWRNSVTLWEDVLGKYPQIVFVYNNLGDGYHSQGRDEDAVTAYKKGIELDPNFPMAYNNLGLAYRALGKNQEAISAHKKAIELKPDYFSGYNNLGVAYNTVNQHKEAMAAYKKAIELKPDYADAYNNLGNVYFDLGKNQEAISAYKKAIELKPDYVVAYNNLGIAYRKIGRQKDSEEVLNTARRLYKQRRYLGQ